MNTTCKQNVPSNTPSGFLSKLFAIDGIIISVRSSCVTFCNIGLQCCCTTKKRQNIITNKLYE